jgi:hypothetical protein
MAQAGRLNAPLVFNNSVSSMAMNAQLEKLSRYWPFFLVVIMILSVLVIHRGERSLDRVRQLDFWHGCGISLSLFSAELERISISPNRTFSVKQTDIHPCFPLKSCEKICEFVNLVICERRLLAISRVPLKLQPEIRHSYDSHWLWKAWNLITRSIKSGGSVKEIMPTFDESPFPIQLFPEDWPLFKAQYLPGNITDHLEACFVWKFQ